MADFDYDRLQQSIAQGVADGLAGRPGAGAAAQETPEQKAERERLRALVKDLDRFKGSLKTSTESAAKWSEFFRTGSMQYKDVTANLDGLQQAINDSTDDEERRLLKAKKREVEIQAGWENTKRATVNFASSLVTTGYTFAKDLAGVTKDIVTNLTQSGSDTRLFTGLFSSGIKILTSAAQAAGGVFGSLGGVVGNLVGIVFPGLGKVISSLLGGLGKAFGAVVGVVGGVAVGAFEMLTAQIDSYVKSFQGLNRAGAAFAGGLGDMLKTAHQGGLTLEQFSRVVSENANNIAAAGLGVTEGSRRLSKALAQGGAEMQRRLLNLGYSVEEQAGLVAETMRSMAGMAGPLKASDREVAIQTEKYAQNLRLIASITGEDAKKKMEQARQDMMNLRFQQQLNKLTGEQRTQVEQAMAAAPAAARKMAIEIANTGTIITPALAVLANSSPEMKRLAEMLADGAKTGNASVGQVAEYMKANGETIRQSMQSQEAMALAAFAKPDSLAGEVSKLMLDTMSYASKATKEAIDSQLKQIKEGAEADKKDPLTNVITTIQQRAQELRVLVESTISKLMQEFGNALSDNVNTIADGLKKLAGALDIEGIGAAIRGILSQFNNLITGTGSIVEKIKNMLGGVDGKEVAGTGGKYAGMGVGGIAGYKVGKAAGEKIPDMLKGFQKDGLKGALGAVLGTGGKPDLGAPNGSAQNPYYVIVMGSNPVADVVTGGPGKTPPPGDANKQPKPGGAKAVPKGKAFGGLAGKFVGGIAGLLGGPVGAAVGGYLGSLAGEALGEFLYDTVMKFMDSEGVEGRARGGSVRGSQPYIVGEEGPELFVPGLSGSIVPNDLLKLLNSGSSPDAAMLVSALNGIVGPVQQQMRSNSLMAREAVEAVGQNSFVGAETLVSQISQILQNNSAPTDTPNTQITATQTTEMTKVLKDQLSINSLMVQQQEQMNSIMQDLRSIQQQILNNTV
jgi:hypothetical protein